MAESTGRDLNKVLEEYNKRVGILKWMLEHDMRDYKVVSETIGKYYIDPQAILQKIDLGV